MTMVYYAEDDEAIADRVREYLSGRGFAVQLFGRIADAKQALFSQCPGIMLVDWNMPDGRGDAFCRWIRARFPQLPVIFLTVRGEGRDIVSGFQNGADDYVVKPFLLEVLESRMRALLRRAGDISGQYLSCGAISLDQGRRAVFYEKDAVSLTPAEYALLLYLLQNKGQTVTREQILEKIWDSNGSFVNDNTLTVTMKRLREKLRQCPCIKTVRSVGYRMEDVECLPEKR